MPFRASALGRTYALGLGLVYAGAAAITASHAFAGDPRLQRLRWPFVAAQAAIFATIALITVLGATAHVSALVAGALSMLFLMMSRLDSESEIAPVVAIAMAGLVYVYVRWGRGAIRMLPAARLALLVASLVLLVVAMVRFHEPSTTTRWLRLRAPGGGETFQTYTLLGGCREAIPAPKDAAEIASGCVDVISKSRAFYIIGFTSAAALLALISVAGAARIRRLSDGTSVPTWT